MRVKECFKCGKEKPLAEFYAHPRMADGHLNKCKECAKRDVRENYAKRRKQYSEYERERNQRPERKAYLQKQQAKYRKRNPEKNRAHAMINRRTRIGNLVPEPCEVCGSQNVEAHHDDYSNPLDVRWLCFKHHRELHGQVVVADMQGMNKADSPDS